MWLPGGLIALLGGQPNGAAAAPPALEPQTAAPAESAAPEPEPGPPAATGDPFVSLAFAAGWQMTEIYQSAVRIKNGLDAPVVAPAEGSGLPCLRALGAAERARLALTEVEVALYKLRGHFAAADRGAPGLARIAPALERAREGDGELLDAVTKEHEDLLYGLMTVDYRLGKAYRLGVELAHTSVSPESHEQLETAFGPRAVSVRSLLEDLASVLPPHSSRAVAISVRTWEYWAADPRIDGTPVSAMSWAGVRATLRRQGELWRSLLSGEKCGEDMLSMPDYVRAASGLIGQAMRLLVKFSRRWAFALAILLALVLCGIAAAFFASSDTVSKVGAGVAAIAGAAGLTGASLRARAGRIAKQVEDNLWATELDQAIAHAITKGPDGWGVSVSDVTLSAAGDIARASRQLALLREFREYASKNKRRDLKDLLARNVNFEVTGQRTLTEGQQVLDWLKALSKEQRALFLTDDERVVAGYPGYFVVERPKGRGADLWRVREEKISGWRRYEDKAAARSAAGLAT